MLQIIIMRLGVALRTASMEDREALKRRERHVQSKYTLGTEK